MNFVCPEGVSASNISHSNFCFYLQVRVEVTGMWSSVTIVTICAPYFPYTFIDITPSKISILSVPLLIVVGTLWIQWWVVCIALARPSVFYASYGPADADWYLGAQHQRACCAAPARQNFLSRMCSCNTLGTCIQDWFQACGLPSAPRFRHARAILGLAQYLDW